MNRTTGWIGEQIGAKVLGSPDVVVAGSVETDSRRCQPGGLYVARIGENADGHDYAAAAVAAGVVALIVERPLDLSAGEGERGAAGASQAGSCVQLVVDDTTIALGQLAKAHLADLRAACQESGRESGRRKRASLQVLGLTGSAGKTTTKDLLARMCIQVGETVAPVASFNNEVGCPLTILRTQETTRFLVLEMGASGPGHISYLTDLAPLDVGLCLMVGSAHLGGFGSPDNLAAAKREIIEGVRPGGVSILNLDDPKVREMASSAPGQVVTFSAAGNSKADIRAVDLELDQEAKARFHLETPAGSADVELQLVGAHQVVNALAATAGALALGVPFACIVRILAEAKADSPHRMKVQAVTWQGQNITVVDDSYNANPDSLAAGLRSAAQIAAGIASEEQRLVVVIGEMLELGEESAQLHREVGEIAGAVGASLVIALGEGATPILEALPGHAEGYAAPNPQAAIRLVRDLVKAGDIVFVKGSNGSGAWQVADELMGARVSQ